MKDLIGWSDVSTSGGGFLKKRRLVCRCCGFSSPFSFYLPDHYLTLQTDTATKHRIQRQV